VRHGNNKIATEGVKYQVVKTLMYVRWKSAPYSML